MRVLVRGGVGLALLAVGYVLGQCGFFESQSVQAQVQDQTLSKDSQEKIKTAYEAIAAAKEALTNEGKYIPATEGLNTFAIMAGGVDAINDLETGRGVDPETFAAIYAGLASPEIRKDIGRDSEGRMTYKNKVIRLYPIARLKQSFTNRDGLIGIE